MINSQEIFEEYLKSYLDRHFEDSISKALKDSITLDIWKSLKRNNIVLKISLWTIPIDVNDELLTDRKKMNQILFPEYCLMEKMSTTELHNMKDHYDEIELTSIYSLDYSLKDIKQIDTENKSCISIDIEKYLNKKKNYFIDTEYDIRIKIQNSKKNTMQKIKTHLEISGYNKIQNGILTDCYFPYRGYTYMYKNYSSNAISIF